MKIRQARKEDVDQIIDLAYSSGPDIYDYVYCNHKHSAKDFIRYEFLSNAGFCSHKNMLVGELNGDVIATACVFNKAQFRKFSLASVFNMIRFYGFFSSWKVLKYGIDTGSVMKEPKDGELYFSNFGVNPDFRGKGYGNLLTNHCLEYAKGNNYKSFALDVATKNTRAEKLYASLGMKVVAEKTFSGYRKGFEVDNAKKMVLLLQ